MARLLVRKIVNGDNQVVAQIIRSVMTEFGAVGPGFSIEDAEVDTMFEAYEGDKKACYVVVTAGEVVGCGGVAPLDGGAEDTCELKKMYFLAEARGRGAGRVLAELLINEARKLGFSKIYIETLEQMEAANGLYKSLGFRKLDGPLGNTGHGGCNTFYLLELKPLEQISIG